MTLLSPEYLWLLLPLFALLLKKGIGALSVGTYGYVLTYVLIVAALARPAIEQEPIESKQLLSDVVIGVDLSYSMRSNDIAPNRLSYAKERLEELLDKHQKSRFAVLGFTTNAIVLSPLTEDKELLLHLFNSLEEKLIITKGSSVMSALKLAREMSDSKEATVVLFTDGADELNYDAEAEFAKENRLRVNIFMTATTTGGTVKEHNGELLKDELGDIVITRENDAAELISKMTGGIYTKDMNELLSALESQDKNDKETKNMIIRNEELFYYFVFFALLVFLISITSLKRYIVVFLLLLGLHVEASQSIESFNKAVELYGLGEYEKALEKFRQVRSADAHIKSIVFYDIGNTYVRLGEFEKARDAYIKSLTLEFSREALENFVHIEGAGEKKEMNTGAQQTKNRSALAKKEQSQKQKEGGGSNMQVSAQAGTGADEGGKKTKSQSMLNTEGSKAKLSSKQYELINKRSIDEKRPW